MFKAIKNIYAKHEMRLISMKYFFIYMYLLTRVNQTICIRIKAGFNKQKTNNDLIFTLFQKD